MSLFILITASLVQATPVYFTDRGSFNSAVGISITDDYSGYSPGVLTNDQMNSVMGETRYEPITIPNQNQVGDVYSYGDGSNYCSGCNGNFKLFFDSTTLTVNGGVFGVGIDIVFHTSRHSSLGDIIPGDTVVEGQVLIEFSDGTFDHIMVPADIGFFAPEIFFIGITNDIGIKSITIGTEPIALRHTWVIDNLTIAKEAPPTLLPKTGQTTCYDSLGNAIPCAGTGQDGDIQAGVQWPSPRFTVTYCDANGPCADQSSDCDSNSSTDTVTDNLTGLMWARDGNLPNGSMTWYPAIDYANNLNLCGYSDWWIPNVNELESLVNADQPDTATWLNTQGFNSVQSSMYLSSTTYAINTNTAWGVGMQDGFVDSSVSKNSSTLYMWPVRAGQYGNPDPSYPANIWETGQQISYATGDDGDMERGVAWPESRFTDYGDGTVTDNLTGLIWTKDANAPGPSVCVPGGTYPYKTWQEALDYVACLNANSYLGYNDWRLPNRKELRSLIDYSKHSPALPEGHPFISVRLAGYWSSTTSTYDMNRAWIVDMVIGYAFYYDKDYSLGYGYMRPVRGGTVTGVDTTPTITTASPPGGTYTSAQDVTLDCNDNGGSGCQATYYCLGEGCDPTTPYTGGNIEVSSSTHLRFYSIDYANNIEEVQEATYTINLPDTTPPSAPANLQANAVSSSQIDLTWGASSDIVGVTGYRIYNADTNVSIATTTQTTYPVIGLNASTTYRFYVTAYDAANNESDPSNTASATTYATGNTPAGSNVNVNLGNGITIIFERVVSPGTTTATVLANPGHNPPLNFRILRGLYYNITTTASYSGTITIIFPYEETGNENNLKVLHWEDPGWNDVTVQPVDTANNKITAHVSSLSPFGIGYYLSSGGYSTGANTNLIALLAMIAISAGLFILRRNRWIKV